MATVPVGVEARRLAIAILIVLLIAIPIVAYFFGDDIKDLFDRQILQNTTASCADFQGATAAAQMSFLQDCNCLDIDSVALPKVSLDAIEGCVRAEVAKC